MTSLCNDRLAKKPVSQPVSQPLSPPPIPHHTQECVSALPLHAPAIQRHSHTLWRRPTRGRRLAQQRKVAVRCKGRVRRTTIAGFRACSGGQQGRLCKPCRTAKRSAGRRGTAAASRAGEGNPIFHAPLKLRPHLCCCCRSRPRPARPSPKASEPVLRFSKHSAPPLSPSPCCRRCLRRRQHHHPSRHASTAAGASKVQAT